MRSIVIIGTKNLLNPPPGIISNLTIVFENGESMYSFQIQARKIPPKVPQEDYISELAYMDIVQKSVILLGLGVACESYEEHFNEKGERLIKHHIKIKKQQKKDMGNVNR